MPKDNVFGEKEKKNMAKNNDTKPHVMGQGEALAMRVKCTLMAVLIGVFFLVVSIVVNFVSSNAQSEQLTATESLNQYRNGSKILTYSVQSYAVTADQGYYDDYVKELNENKSRDNAIAKLKKISISDSEWESLDQIMALSDGLVPLEESAMQCASAGDTDKACEYVFSDEYRNTVDTINTMTDEIIDKIQSEKNNKRKILNIIVIVTQILFIGSFLTVLYEVQKIIAFSKAKLLEPIKKVSVQMGELANGNFRATLDMEEDSSEVGSMVASINFMKRNIIGMIQEISDTLGEMSNGNYNITIKQEYVGEFIRIKESFISIGEKMREMLLAMREVSASVDKGSEQLSCAAEDLAESCTSQALKVSELVKIFADMEINMENNAAVADESVELAARAGNTLQTGNEKMQELKEAIAEISRCSEQIGTIIGDIEDIASQTNLLSLNAAIEAARAGEAGRGFAVVAEQVKSLADESAQAAGRTTNLIKTTIEAVDKGISIANETVENMSQVMGDAMDATQKMSQIASILQEEVGHMRDVKDNITQVSAAVDNNSATSEETAAVSEQQKAQVESMVSLMDKFNI